MTVRDSCGEVVGGSRTVVLRVDEAFGQGETGSPEAGGLASTPLDAKPESRRRSALHTLEGVNSMLRAGHKRIAEGEYSLAELAELAEVKLTVEGLVDAAVSWLGANDDVSYRELGIALGRTRQAVEKKWPGVSGREAGGQPSRLR